MRAHDDGAGMNARCRAENAIGGIAKLDQKIGCAFESSARMCKRLQLHEG